MLLKISILVIFNTVPFLVHFVQMQREFCRSIGEIRKNSLKYLFMHVLWTKMVPNIYLYIPPPHLWGQRYTLRLSEYTQ